LGEKVLLTEREGGKEKGLEGVVTRGRKVSKVL
jgi:hypothetical protein